MNEFTAVALAQLEEIENKVSRRIENANSLLSLINDFEVSIPKKFLLTILTLTTR